MKGNSEFVYWLVAGLVILVLLMIFLGTAVYKFPGKETNLTRERGIVEAVKTFNIPEFCSANLLETRTTELIGKNVFNGLLFGEDKIVYNLSKSGLQDVTVRFRVIETNDLGNLVIRINGQILENRHFAPGEYTIVVPAEFISDHMLVEIAAESSYWKIWAPTLYVIQEASVTFTSYFDESSQFKFYLGEEYLNLEFSKVDIVFRTNVGTLIADLNGRTIWNSPVNDLQSIRLDKADLRLGDNIIKLRAARDSQLCGQATVVVVFLTRFPELINQSGIVTAIQPLNGYTTQFVYPSY